jgi:hypothetical protein
MVVPKFLLFTQISSNFIPGALIFFVRRQYRSIAGAALIWCAGNMFHRRMPMVVRRHHLRAAIALFLVVS